jgi:hypothetical protein
MDSTYDNSKDITNSAEINEEKQKIIGSKDK